MAYTPSTFPVSNWTSPINISGTDLITNLDEAVNQIISTDANSVKNWLNNNISATLSPYLVSEFNKVYAETNASAVSAASSASTATTQAGIATTKASEASASATSASNSASTATTQASNASNSATSASNSATTATTQAGIATTQATNASNSASSASSSATTATTQAGIATTKAAEAAASAANAQTIADSMALGAIGNINSPLLDMPLKNSLVMKSGVGSATFTRASTATYIDRYGVLKAAAVDEPRFEKEGYLNEGVSTNLLTYSDQFDNAAWSKVGLSVTPNIGTDPYGTTLADLLVESATTTTHQINQPFTAVSGTTYTYSCFASPKERSTIQVVPYGTIFNTTYVNFDLLNGLVSAIGTNIEAKMTLMANGSYRCSVTTTAISSGSGLFYTIIANSPTMARYASYTGDGTSGLYIFGAQLEALPFATSYIPTVASTVTRAVDALSVTAVNNSNGVTNRFSEETVSFDFATLGGSSNYIGYVFEFNGQSTAYRAYYSTSASVMVLQYGTDAVGGSQLGIGTAPLTVMSRYVLSHNHLGITKSYLNGILKSSGTSGTANSTIASTTINVGSNFAANSGSKSFGHYANFRIWDKALTAQEVALA